MSVLIPLESADIEFLLKFMPGNLPVEKRRYFKPQWLNLDKNIVADWGGQKVAHEKIKKKSTEVQISIRF